MSKTLKLAVLPLAAIGLSAAGLSACQSPPAAPASAEPVAAAELATSEGPATPAVPVAGVRDGTTTVRVGQTVTIALPANPTTGYGWALADFDEAVLKRGTPFDAHTTDAHEPGMVGVGGTTRWTFEAASAGETTLTFTYGRSWAKDASDETATYRVVVR